MDLKRKILVLVLMVFALTWAGNASACYYGDCEGCTPGYWKQEQHLDSWVGYLPTDYFDDVFGVEAFPGMTLLDVLRQGGGQCKALGRHAVAALLNASTTEVNYTVEPWLVFEMVTYAFDNDECEAVKNILEYWNQEGCPLN